MFDSHVHASPDIYERAGDDMDLAHLFKGAGYAGFVLKGHYESTVGRAHLASRLSGLAVYGGVVLNQPCGGINASAVASCLHSGGRIVWMPTEDSHAHNAAGLRRMCHRDARMRRCTYALPPVDESSADDAFAILSMISDYDAVIATGHLSERECRWLTEHAKRYGISRLILTHPSYVIPGMSLGAIRSLRDIGAFVEITAYQLLHQNDCTAEYLAAVARSAGDRLLLSSDAGQTDSPTPPEALAYLIDQLQAAGLDRGWLTAAASEVPYRVIAPAN